MKKFDAIYANMKNGDLDNTLEQIENKINTKAATREEYEEFKKLSNMKANISKIDNVMKFKENLEKQKTEIEKEILNITNLKESNDKTIKLEEELNALQIEKNEINVELKKKDLKPEKETELKEKLSKVNAKMEKNQTDFSENQKNISNIQQPKEKNTIEELKTKSMEISTKISKCNMIVNNLAQGKSWDFIEIKLDNWKDRKFTSKEPIDTKVKPIETTVEKTNKEEKQEETIEEIDLEEELEKVKIKENEPLFKNIDEYEKENVGNYLEETFESRHPRLSKVTNWFKEKFNNVKTKTINFYRDHMSNDDDALENPKYEKKEKLEKDREDVDKILEKQNKNLMEYIQKVMQEKEKENATEKEEKAENHDSFKEEIRRTAFGPDARKLQEAKRQAYERETKKFGQAYANNSYHADEKDQEK